MFKTKYHFDTNCVTRHKQKQHIEFGDAASNQHVQTSRFSLIKIFHLKDNLPLNIHIIKCTISKYNFSKYSGVLKSS